MSEPLPTMDRNKTELTHRVTAAASLYLSECGFKPVETEVPIEQGWIADIAGACQPTPTELTKMKLVPPRARYGRVDYQQRNDERLRQIRAMPSVLTAMVE